MNGRQLMLVRCVVLLVQLTVGCCISLINNQPEVGKFDPTETLRTYTFAPDKFGSAPAFVTVVFSGIGTPYRAVLQVGMSTNVLYLTPYANVAILSYSSQEEENVISILVTASRKILTSDSSFAVLASVFTMRQFWLYQVLTPTTDWFYSFYKQQVPTTIQYSAVYVDVKHYDFWRYPAYLLIENWGDISLGTPAAPIRIRRGLLPTDSWDGDEGFINANPKGAPVANLAVPILLNNSMYIGRYYLTIGNHNSVTKSYYQPKRVSSENTITQSVADRSLNKRSEILDSNQANDTRTRKLRIVEQDYYEDQGEQDIREFLQTAFIFPELNSTFNLTIRPLVPRSIGFNSSDSVTLFYDGYAAYYIDLESPQKYFDIPKRLRKERSIYPFYVVVSLKHSGTDILFGGDTKETMLPVVGRSRRPSGLVRQADFDFSSCTDSSVPPSLETVETIVVNSKNDLRGVYALLHAQGNYSPTKVPQQTVQLSVSVPDVPEVVELGACTTIRVRAGQIRYFRLDITAFIASQLSNSARIKDGILKGGFVVEIASDGGIQGEFQPCVIIQYGALPTLDDSLLGRLSTEEAELQGANQLICRTRVEVPLIAQGSYYIGIVGNIDVASFAGQRLYPALIGRQANGYRVGLRVDSVDDAAACSGRGNCLLGLAAMPELQDVDIDHYDGEVPLARCDCQMGSFGGDCQYICPGLKWLEPLVEGDPQRLVNCSGNGQCFYAPWLLPNLTCANAVYTTNSTNREGDYSTSFCVCQEGWVGSACELRCPYGWNQKPCSGNGVCVAKSLNKDDFEEPLDAEDAFAVCNCHDGYSGGTCAKYTKYKRNSRDSDDEDDDDECLVPIYWEIIIIALLCVSLLLNVVALAK